jgi:hypothetical protein
LRALGAFAGDDPDELGIETQLGRIAALSLFERSKWGRKHRESILDEALSSPEMSYYLAAAIQPYTEEWTSLIKVMANCPRCSYAALALPHLPTSGVLLDTRIKLHEGVRANSLFYWALQFGQAGSDKTKYIENFLRTDAPDAETCALSLVLAPKHPHAQEWLAGLENQAELAYRARKLFHLSGQFDEEFLLAPRLGSIARQDPSWAYHWERDFAEDDEDAAFSLLPHLHWIAELIDAGVVSVEHADVIDDRASVTMDMDHWLRSSFLLFAAGKAGDDERKN